MSAGAGPVDALAGAATGPATSARVAVAFSGGRDSLALLHATVHAAHLHGLQVVALHVHHGLQPQADAWLRSAQALCERWRRRGLPIRLRWHRVTTRPQPGDSLEAWARRERYAALAAMAREEGVGVILLAHHSRDQAETVLLQALRGAGPAGLSAMPKIAVREGLTWARPWLNCRREAIDAYIQRHRLKPVEDPSNAHLQLARNRLRHSVWPSLMAAFPDTEKALRAVAENAQLAAAALAELAAMDLTAARQGDRLSVLPLRSLSPARQANALRAWLAQALGQGAPGSLVTRLLEEGLASGASGRWPAGPGREIRLYRGLLSMASADLRPVGLVQQMDLSQPGFTVLPDWGGCFETLPVPSGGLPAHCLISVTLRPRAGGERFQLAANGLARSLKKQYQACGLAETERGGPLVWQGDQLLFVPGLGLDARPCALPGAPRMSLSWHADLQPHVLHCSS